MWATDELVKATLKMRSEEAERIGLVSDARRQAGEGKSGRGWHWRIEPGMEEAFEYLSGWFLLGRQEASVETAAPAPGAAQLGGRPAWADLTEVCCPYWGPCQCAAYRTGDIGQETGI